MSLLIILRKKLVPNRFNELVLKSLDTGEGDNVIICSGFFQENKFSASFHTGLCCILKRHKIKATTIGVYNKMWEPQYRQFRNNLISCGNIVESKKMKSFKWHAKIFILKKGNEPIFGIIGSSNMTSRAFGIWNDFNFEADVVLWDIKSKKINQICQQQTETTGENENSDVIYADYSESRNQNRTAMDRLLELERELNIENLENFE